MSLDGNIRNQLNRAPSDGKSFASGLSNRGTDDADAGDDRPKSRGAHSAAEKR